MEVGTLEWKGLQRPVKDLGMVGEGERSVEDMDKSVAEEAIFWCVLG